jgi:long-chain acyl-CoA synthetase
MLDLNQYTCLGAALRDALERFAKETCLIEADRDREKSRLTYSDFKDLALPLTRALQDADFDPGDRAAIIMTNQSKWLVSAYAVFYCGGELVPLDYKLTAVEHLALLAHSKAKVLVVEYFLWKAIMLAPSFAAIQTKMVLVTEAPMGTDLGGAFRWEDFKRRGAPDFIERKREDTACIVYSSGTGGRAKGCVLTHENYLEQCKAISGVFEFGPGTRYLSVLPTNHAIDFVVGFIRPFVSGACVVHLRTLRPEFVRDAFVRYRITHVFLVPLVVKNLERGMKANFAALSPVKRLMLDRFIAVNKFFTRRRPNVKLSRWLLPQVHQGFGGRLVAMGVGGAYMEPTTLQFFYDLGIPITNGYGLTETTVCLTLNDFKPFRADTVGKPLAGVEIRLLNPDDEGIGEVAARSKTIMSHYLDDPELTLETIVDGWLITGDLGRFERHGHLQLFGRKKNMIVTEGGKNVYPEDIEKVFEGLPVKEFCVFAANYIWPAKSMSGEMLVLVLRLDANQRVDPGLIEDIGARNRKLPDFKRIHGYVVADSDFPRTASMKIIRPALATALSTTKQGSDVVNL